MRRGLLLQREGGNVLPVAARRNPRFTCPAPTGRMSSVNVSAWLRTREREIVNSRARTFLQHNEKNFPWTHDETRRNKEYQRGIKVSASHSHPRQMRCRGFFFLPSLFHWRRTRQWIPMPPMIHASVKERLHGAQQFCYAMFHVTPRYSRATCHSRSRTPTVVDLVNRQPHDAFTQDSLTRPCPTSVRSGPA